MRHPVTGSSDGRAAGFPAKGDRERLTFRALVCLPALCLVSCFTSREEVGEVRTSYSVNDSFWGASDDTSKNADDSDEIRSRFADSGWTTGEDGEMTAKHQDLYGENRVGRGRNPFGKEEAKLSQREAETSLFRTPEYLERQGYGVEESRFGKDRGLFGADRARETGREADTAPKDGFLAGLNPFKTGTAREQGETFRTSEDRIASRARMGAAIPTSVSQGEMGYFTDSVATLDDVKKLLNPEKFD